MDFVGIDPSETREVEHGGVTWIFRVMDDSKFAILDEKHHEAIRAHVEDQASDDKRLAAIRAAAELVRWGVLGAKERDPLPTERETWCGVEHQVIAREWLAKLLRVRSGGLLAWLASEVVRTNGLDEATILGFR